MERLKECPFCGGEAIIQVVEPHKHHIAPMPDYDGGAFAECMKCSACMSADTEQEAIEKWNSRADVGATSEQVAEWARAEREGRMKIAPPRRKGTGWLIFRDEVHEVDWQTFPFDFPMASAKDGSFQWDFMFEDLYSTRAEAEAALQKKIDKIDAEVRAAKADRDMAEKKKNAAEEALENLKLAQANEHKDRAGQIEALKKQLAVNSSGGLAAAKVHFEAAKDAITKLARSIEGLAEAGDKENAGKLARALAALCDKSKEAVKEWNG